MFKQQLFCFLAALEVQGEDITAPGPRQCDDGLRVPSRAQSCPCKGGCVRTQHPALPSAIAATPGPSRALAVLTRHIKALEASVKSTPLLHKAPPQSPVMHEAAGDAHTAEPCAVAAAC